jgi:hypothetical protein
MKYLILICSFLLALNHSEAQFIESEEIAIKLNSDKNDDYSVLPIGNNGVVLLNYQTNLYGKKGNLILSRYDQSFKKIWVNFVDLGFSFELVKYYQGETHLYCLLKEKDRLNIKLVQVDFINGDLVVVETRMLTDMKIEFFGVVNKKAVIAGEYNDRPVAELHKMFDKSSKVLSKLYRNNLKINSLDFDEDSGEIFLALLDSRKCKFEIITFDSEGKLLDQFELGDKKNAVLNLKYLKVSDNQKFFAGNFAENCSDYSSGFFFFQKNHSDGIKYIKFNDLNNFFAYLPEKRREKVSKRIDNKKTKGKEAKLRYRLNMQDPLIIGNEIIMVAEVYYPEYKSTTYFSRNNLPFMGQNFRTDNYAPRYRFSHALFAGFNLNGGLVWDYSVDMKNLDSEWLFPKVQAQPIDEKLLVAFPKDEKIFLTGIVKGNNKNVTSTVLLSENKNKNSEFTMELMSWFKDNFLVFGYKTPNSGFAGEPEEFFYLKKLTYDPNYNTPQN